MSKKVIDVSSYQGSIDWAKAKAAGVEGAILKVIRKDLTPDKQFEANWSGCQKAGVPIYGVYNYSYATSTSKAEADAKKVIEILNGRKAKVWLDVEDVCQKGLGKKLIEIINVYYAVIKAAGLEFGVYTGLSFYSSYIKPYACDIDAPFWIARYPSTKAVSVSTIPATNKQPEISHTLEGWQWSSAGSVPGISGKVDMNMWYGEIPTTDSAENPYPIPRRVIFVPKIGTKMKGEDVKWVQYHLIRLGFLPELNSKGKSNLDGIYGKDSKEAAVKAQAHYGIAQDGIAGADTRRILRWN